MSWTACCDDNCSIHLSDKQGSGWFPTRPRRELNVINRKPKLHREEATLAKELEYAELQICETPRELTPPTTNEDLVDHQGWPNEFYRQEFSEEDEETTPETLTFKVEGNELFRQIVTYVEKSQHDVFPDVDGATYVNPYELDLMLDYIRATMTNKPKIEVEYEPMRYIQERPPIGTEFQPDGSYIDPTGTRFPRALRQEVTNLRECYRRCALVQKAINTGKISASSALTQLTRIAGAYHSNHTFPHVTEVPEWKGHIPPGLHAHIKGRVSLKIKDDTIILTPRDITEGPLHWEVQLDYSDYLIDDDDSGNDEAPTAEAATGSLTI